MNFKFKKYHFNKYFIIIFFQMESHSCSNRQTSGNYSVCTHKADRVVSHQLASTSTLRVAIYFSEHLSHHSFACLPVLWKICIQQVWVK